MELIEWPDTASTPYKSLKHPVIRLGMSCPSTENPEQLMSSVIANLRTAAEPEKVKLAIPDYNLILMDLLAKPATKYGTGDVILTDGQDDPA
jgi:hypothetical protein